jgi:hypothetical protein
MSKAYILGSSQYITGKIPVSEDSSSASPVAKPTSNSSNDTITRKGLYTSGRHMFLVYTSGASICLPEAIVILL